MCEADGDFLGWAAFHAKPVAALLGGAFAVVYAGAMVVFTFQSLVVGAPIYQGLGVEFTGRGIPINETAACSIVVFTGRWMLMFGILGMLTGCYFVDIAFCCCALLFGMSCAGMDSFLKRGAELKACAPGVYGVFAFMVNFTLWGLLAMFVSLILFACFLAPLAESFEQKRLRRRERRPRRRLRSMVSIRGWSSSLSSSSSSLTWLRKAGTNATACCWPRRAPSSSRPTPMRSRQTASPAPSSGSSESSSNSVDQDAEMHVHVASPPAPPASSGAPTRSSTPAPTTSSTAAAAGVVVL